MFLGGQRLVAGQDPHAAAIPAGGLVALMAVGPARAVYGRQVLDDLAQTGVQRRQRRAAVGEQGVAAAAGDDLGVQHGGRRRAGLKRPV